jgi:hypothetical protein
MSASEVEINTPETTGPGIDTAEAEARAKGWVPKDEYKGKRDWKPAVEWLADGDELATLRRELAKTQEALLDFGRQNREAAMAETKKQLEAKLDDAVEAGDKGEVRKVAAELKKVEQEPDIPKPAKAFIDSNKDWFGFHERATDYARMRERKLLNDGVAIEDVYDTIAGEVKGRFPELFDNPNASRAAAVESGGTVRSRKKAGHGLVIGDLPEAYQKIAKDFVKRGVISEEKYIQDLIDTGAISRT